MRPFSMRNIAVLFLMSLMGILFFPVIEAASGHGMPSESLIPTQNDPLTSMSTPTPKIYSIGDLHIHTICSDGRNDYETMLKQALKMRYRFIAITDHRFADTAVCKENIRKCQAETRLLCIPGMEVTGRVHLLAIGIHKPINEKLPLKNQIEEIHRQGGLAIAAHPFAQGTRYSEEELFHSGLDALECGGISPQEWARFNELQKQYRIPCVYNSDAHNLFQMLAYNICEGDIKNFEDLKQAIRSNRCNFESAQ